MKSVLSIAGSDSSGGAGIQADLKTFTVHGVYGMTAITAITAQNTTGVFGIENISAALLGKQLDAVFTDIYPDAVKIGMVSAPDLIEVIATKLIQYQAKNIVLDPVMVSTSGHRLLAQEAEGCLIEKLLPLAHIITPNIPEAEVLSGIPINHEEDMILAAQKIGIKAGYYVLIKGGHNNSACNDLLFKDNDVYWLKGQRIDSPNTHGTGCTLSSAIASNLALGYDIKEAVCKAKDYVYQAIADGIKLGKGHGPINHCYPLKNLHF